MKLAQIHMAKRPARFLSTGCKSLWDDADLGAVHDGFLSARAAWREASRLLVGRLKEGLTI